MTSVLDPTELPLAGLRVLDLSRDLAGPFCAQILSDLGAEVTKVENPDGGDEMRHWPPQHAGTSIYFMIANRNKRCVAVDLNDERMRDLVLAMVDEADVVVQNFRPSTAAKFGLTPEQLLDRRPDLVVCSVSGYPPGPNHGRPAYDSAIQAYSGIMGLTGDPEGEVARVGVAIVDFTTGLYAAIGVLAALRKRDDSGVGDHVEVTLAAAAATTMSLQIMAYRLTGYEFHRLGTSHPTTVPSKVFHTATDDVLLLAANDRQWASLCVVLGHPEWVTDERFATNPLRVKHRNELQPMIQEILLNKPLADWMPLLDEQLVAYAPVRTVAQVAEDPETLAYLQTREHPTFGEVAMVSSPVTFGGAKLPVRLPPPELGEHTEEVLAKGAFTAGRERTS